MICNYMLFRKKADKENMKLSNIIERVKSGPLIRYQYKKHTRKARKRVGEGGAGGRATVQLLINDVSS